MHGALVLPLVSIGMIEASTIRNPDAVLSLGSTCHRIKDVILNAVVEAMLRYGVEGPVVGSAGDHSAPARTAS